MANYFQSGGEYLKSVCLEGSSLGGSGGPLRPQAVIR